MPSVFVNGEISSAKTEVCDFKKPVINKEVIITNNKVISINQLNCKVPDRTHGTEELVGHKEHQGTIFCLHHGNFAEGHTLQSTLFELFTNVHTL
jgi:hypothetical protein